MKEVLLNGFLGDKYGRHWKMKADNIRDIFNCIEANRPTFRKTILDFAESGGDLSIQYGDMDVEDPEELLYNIGPDTVIITPLPAGAKGGKAKLLLAAIIVASMFIPGSGAVLTKGAADGASAIAAIKSGASLNIAGTLAVATATNLAMIGIMEIMAPDPSVDGADANEDYLFDSAENTVAENNAVPVLFGEMIVPGVLISTATVASFTPYDSTSANFTTSTTAATGGGRGSLSGDAARLHMR